MLPVIIFTASGKLPLLEGLGVLGVVVFLMLINIVVFYYTRLEVKISEEGIAYRWWPFFRKHSVLKWADIDYVTMSKHSALKVGYHFDRKFGKVHKVDGINGYQVVLYNGKKYFFGTQRKLSVESVLQQTGKLKL